jgi:predicted PhzF superfamily epimerase YddE/YHI9
VGPTLVEVGARDGRPPAATVHQGSPTFGAAVPRERVAALLCLDVDDLHDELDPMPVNTGIAYTIVPLKTQRALAHIDLDLALLDAFARDFAEAYPCAFTGRKTPWIEARGSVQPVLRGELTLED